KPMAERMSKLWRTLSFRKKRSSSRRHEGGGGSGGSGGSRAGASFSSGGKPQHWQDDERKVREGSCSFQVKYLGCMEAYESRGMQVCEEAIKNLMKAKSKHHKRAVLYVNGEALRVVDEITKGLIVDQTIEKVSFCAPDRNHDKGFAYICRDGTARRWMCHGFLAVKESGERLSHAVGCAFAICLERKQQSEREKESAAQVQVSYNDKGTVFERTGSFRQATLTERKLDPQSAILPEPVPVTQRPEARIDSRVSVPRPQANPDLMYQRQSSLRLFPKLESSGVAAFKDRAYSSMRMTSAEAQQARAGLAARGGAGASSAIPEASASTERLHDSGPPLPPPPVHLTPNSSTTATTPTNRYLSTLSESEETNQQPTVAASSVATAAWPPSNGSATASAGSYNPFLPIQQPQPTSVNWSSSTAQQQQQQQQWNNFNNQQQTAAVDPFDVAWADRAASANQPSRTNPFLQQQVPPPPLPQRLAAGSKAFEVQM
ncbi:hypothetical protein BOX15_Mlig009962g1, partial [Macrostomum lignano]